MRIDSRLLARFIDLEMRRSGEAIGGFLSKTYLYGCLVFRSVHASFCRKKDGAIRLLRAASEHDLCIYPSVDHDPLFDKIRSSPEFKAVRQAGIDCQKKFAPFARIQTQ